MKRRILLALVLVLTTASVAGAVPIITGPTVIWPGETVTLTLEGTVAEASGGTAGNSNTPLGGFGPSGVFIDITNAPYYYAPGYNNPKLTGSTISNVSSGSANMGGMATLIAPYYYGIYFTAMSANPWSESTDVDIGPWFSFDVTLTANHISQGGKTDGSEYLPVDIGWLTDLGGLDLQVIPEPVTIALLGLGGLALLGKRRKYAKGRV